MFKRLNTDASIGHMTVQFVPLKVTTKGEEWGRWARKYPPEGKGIPIIYVIRADGKKLYGKSGTLPGPQLGALMRASLAESGRVLNNNQVGLLKSTIEAVRAAMEKEDTAAAVKALSAVNKIGPPGELNSFSTVAQEVDQLAVELVEQGDQTLADAQGKLADSETVFDGAMLLAGAKVAYAPLTAMRKKVAAAYAEANRNAEAKEALQQAEAIQKALARRSIRDGKVAARDLSRVIERYPGTPAAEQAAAYIEEITGQPPQVDPSDAADGYRTWSDATGKFRIEAKLVAKKSGWVQLQTKDGKKISVQIKKLSPEDQAVVGD